jgi:ferric-dicitrate binding protein FerR (iron transport regulator)
VPQVPPDLRMMQRLLEAVVDLKAAHGRPAPAIAALAEAVERIEVVQARIEARLDALEEPATTRREGRFRLVSALALAVAVASLAWGVVSFLP